MIIAAYQIHSLFEDKRDIPVGLDYHLSVSFSLEKKNCQNLSIFFLIFFNLIVVIVM